MLPLGINLIIYTHTQKNVNNEQKDIIMLLDNIMAVDADETIVASEMAELEFADAQSAFDDACADCDEVQLATILGESAGEFLALENEEALACAQKMFARFGEGCTVEGLGAKVKEFGEKSLEVLKQLWARFTELIKRMFVNIRGKMKKFKALRAKVGGFGTSVKWVNENKRVFLYCKGGSVKNLGVISKSIKKEVVAFEEIAGNVSKNLTKGVWNIKKKDTDTNREFWDKYKEEVRNAKDKGDTWSASDYKKESNINDVLTHAIKYGGEIMDACDASLSMERIIKAVKIKTLDVTKNTVDPKIYVRRVTRMVSLLILTEAKMLGAVNAILANVKKA